MEQKELNENLGKKQEVISYSDLALFNGDILLGRISERFVNFLKQIVDEKPDFEGISENQKNILISKIEHLLIFLNKIQFPIPGPVGAEIRKQFMEILDAYRKFISENSN